MTVHTKDHSADRSPGTAPLRLTHPAELLAAIPALLGFRPRDSLVVICLGGPSGRRVQLTVRVDVPTEEEGPALARQLVSTVARRGAVQVLLALIGGGGGGDPGHPPRRGLLDDLLAAFDAAGTAVVGRVWAADIAAGARWSCYDPCGCVGLLDDPATSPVAAAAVAAGLVTFTDRAELAAVVAPADPEALSRRSARLDAAIDATLSAGSFGGGSGEPVDGSLGAVRAALDEAAAGRLALDDDDVVRLGLALGDLRVRDTCLDWTVRAAGDGPEAAAIEQLWTALTREIPDPESAEPATLLAVAAFLRGNGGLANVALERAQRAWPGHRLSRLLDAAIAGGLSPSRLRCALQEGEADDRDC